MTRTVVQIYEIQDRAEARKLLELGVDHIGSVLMRPEISRRDVLAEAISFVSESGGKSSLIPLFLDPEAISRALDCYRPDIVHFCEALSGENGDSMESAFLRQRTIRERFPEIRIMRSVPIGEVGREGLAPTLGIARMFEPISDFFLTDTLVADESDDIDQAQPVSGFVGITGKTCSWDVAADLVRASRIPVILAGGISPENVLEGIRRVRPAGVDSCTLTNAVDRYGQPIRFRKDLEKVKRLVDAVRRDELDNDMENDTKL